ncbi:ABC transporter substrate-binding protein [Mesorhizobium sp. CAU 1741]|uniref:ABC transporter substrate-binding protein n=1 Tax=Mesorhizobium sp. CAU 1741 TaxID=3140366 RepID=UPI00325B34FD
MSMKSHIVAATITLAVGAPGFYATAAHAADDVTIRINFTPWGMHAPIFAAKSQGFYEEEDINLSIVPPSQGQQNEVFIARGEEQFGLSNSDSFLKARANGLPVVAIMADQPSSPAGIISLKESGIDSPEKLEGKKITWIQSNIEGMLNPLLESGGLERSDIELMNVTRGAEVQLLAAGQVDALYGFTYGQALTLEENGYEVNVLALKDYGLDIYGTVFYTSETVLENDPELVERFLRATLKGYEWTLANQQEAVSYVIEVSPDRNLELETRKLGIIYDTYATPEFGERFGLMSDAKWTESIDILGGDLPTKPEVGDLYTNEFVEKLQESADFTKALSSTSN